MRTVRTYGVSLTGTEAELVTVEARFERADRRRTEVVLSGLPDAVLRESRGRLVSALEANGFRLGQGRLFLNLVPAGVRKHGEILDLPLALGAVAASGYLEGARLKDTLFLGEVGIDGRIYAVPGGLAAAVAARREGFLDLVGPPATAGEASCLPGVRAWSADCLGDVVAWVARGGEGLTSATAPAAVAPPAQAAVDLDRVRGQAEAKRALAVAAAGGHALLLSGPPGTGKSLLARALVSLLPEPPLEEKLEITLVLSAARRWPGGLVSTRPFRAPHHTTSYAGLVGGGSPPAPGEITMAHGGVLFLDELPEFARATLEALRQPLEEGRVTLSRAGRQLELPCRFQLVVAMNPCPCGYRGHGRLVCTCGPAEVRRYRRRISGPLLDRIDLRLELPPPRVSELATPAKNGETAAAVAARVKQAHRRAFERQASVPNARLDTAELDRVAPMDGAQKRLLERAVDLRGFSARAVQRLRRSARSIADLEDSERVATDHVAQAIALRGSVP